MSVVIPVNNDGARRVTVEISEQRLTFRTYFSTGQANMWLLDIYDNDAAPLIVGINLVPGSDNVLKGHGDVLNGFQLYVLTFDDHYTAPTALGTTVGLIMYAPGEENLFSPGDPLLYLGLT